MSIRKYSIIFCKKREETVPPSRFLQDGASCGASDGKPWSCSRYLAADRSLSCHTLDRYWWTASRRQRQLVDRRMSTPRAFSLRGALRVTLEDVRSRRLRSRDTLAPRFPRRDVSGVHAIIHMRVRCRATTTTTTTTPPPLRAPLRLLRGEAFEESPSFPRATRHRHFATDAATAIDVRRWLGRPGRAMKKSWVCGSPSTGYTRYIYIYIYVMHAVNIPRTTL